jgi:Transposase.
MAPSVITIQEKKFKKKTSVAEVMASIFLDSVGIVSVKFLERGGTFNPEQYMQT